MGLFALNNELIAGATENAATSGAVVVPVSELYSSYITNTTAAIAATLADGAFQGQMKIIRLKTLDTNSMVVTPAHFTDGATITFDATGEVAILIWAGSGWTCIYTDATIGA